VLPIVASAVATGILKPGTEAEISSSLSDIQLSQEQRIKLAEALMFSIRRRATTDEFVQVLVNIMVFGSVERIGSQTGNPKDTGGQLLIQEETQNYFFRLDRKEELEQETQEEKWEEQDIRLKTGGPVFAMEETDVVRSARVSVLAELASESKPSSLAPHCRLLVRLAIDILRLDSSRLVCRAASLLARELYGCLLREQDELAEAIDDPQNRSVNPIPLAVALISSDEELLLSTLQNHASSRGDESERRIHDPATTVRCQEAIRLREQAEEAGVLTAARLVLSQGELNHIPNILTSFRQNHSGIIEIDKVNSLG
jgi:hypothetical protein